MVFAWGYAFSKMPKIHYGNTYVPVIRTMAVIKASGKTVKWQTGATTVLLS